MDGIALQAESHQQRIDAEDALHIGQHGDAAATPGRHRFHTVNFFHGLRGGLKGIGRNGNEETVSAFARSYRYLYIWRGDGLQVSDELFRDAGAVLVGHQAHGKFGVGRRGQDRLGAGSGVAAPDAADIQARADAGAFKRGIAFLPFHLGDVQELFVFFHIEGRACQIGAVGSREFHHIVVETGHIHPAVCVVKGGDHLAEGRNRIGHRAAIMAGMEIFVRSGYRDFHIAQAAHAAVDGRYLVGNHRGIRNQDDIGREFLFVCSHPSRQRGASDFFFAFEDKLHIVTEFPFAQQVFEGFDVHEQLALVVVGAAAPDGLFSGSRIRTDDRLERIGAPFLQRLGRLHVVMAIDQHRTGFRIHRLDAEYHRISRCRTDFGRIGPRLQQQGLQPLCAGVHIIFMFRFGAYRRNPQQGKQFRKKPLPILFDILFHIVNILPFADISKFAK